MATQLVSLVFPLATGANTPVYMFKDGSGNYYEAHVLYDPVSGNSASIGSSGLAVNGSVSVLSLPSLPAGSNAIGSVSVSSLPSLPTGSNNIGSVNIANTPSVTVSGTPTVSVTNNVSVSPDGCSYLNINDGNAHTISASLLVGFCELSGAAQTPYIRAYDGTNTSGTVLTASLVLGGGQIITFPRDGIKVTSGSITIQCSAAPTSPGIQVLYHA